MSDESIIELIKADGFEIVKKKGELFVEAEGLILPVAHPFSLHAKLYRSLTDEESKYQHLKRMYELLWPDLIPTWNYWTERRFRAHCRGKKYITYAGGASSAKSFDAAALGLLFWFANPGKRLVLIASTTLESLNSRIFGYATRMLSEMNIPLKHVYQSGKPPKILYNVKDKIHGVYAVAAKQGDDDKAIRDIIGRHPEEGTLVILDEATDMPTALLQAFPNLEAGDKFFQVMAIGNSNSKNDLHGALSWPKDGWKSINPMETTEWETTQKDGICLFFNCYDSPAIHETDPGKRALLSRFLPTLEQVNDKKKLYGKDSAAFYRFVMGFWRDDGTDDIVFSSLFLNEFHIRALAEWSGFFELQIVGGLDVAFSSGGDQCILRLGVLGQDTSGKIVLDFRRDELLFRIPISATSGVSAELQIADQVLKILSEYNCNLGNVAIDATGQGRALGEVIRLRGNSIQGPIKIYTTKVGNVQQRSFDVIVKTSLELYTDIRDFVQTDQLRGIDEKSIGQLTSRLIKTSGTRRVLESKAEFKARMGAVSPSLAHSPDEADSLSLCLQAAKIKFGFCPGQKRDSQKKESFDIEKWYTHLMEAKASEEKHVVSPPTADFSGEISVSDPLARQR